MARLRYPSGRGNGGEMGGPGVTPTPQPLFSPGQGQDMRPQPPDVSIGGPSIGGPKPGSPVPISGSEGPRERAVPRRPTAPMPLSGQPGANVGPAMPPQSPQPFQPMPSPGAAGLVTPGAGGGRLFGRFGGLFGGGLGIASQDAAAPNQDPISGLIQALQNRRGGGGFGSFGG